MKHLRTLALIADVGHSGSIRKTGERLNITPSALTRKIQDFEQELGIPVFDRLPQGMRLNAAGELLVRYIRNQELEFDRFRSQVADLSGVRRGHVSIACSQAFADHLMPREVAAYRTQFPQVTFMVHVRDHASGTAAVTEFEADLALLINPPPAPDMQILNAGSQPLCALMRSDHPLAVDGPLRLRDCLAYPVAMPDKSLAIRHLLDLALTRKQQRMMTVVESGSLEFLRNCVLNGQLLSFQVSIGIPTTVAGLHARPLDARDIAPIDVVLGQYRGRALPIATAKFADQLSRHLIWD